MYRHGSDRVRRLQIGDQFVFGPDGAEWTSYRCEFGACEGRHMLLLRREGRGGLLIEESGADSASWIVTGPEGALGDLASALAGRSDYNAKADALVRLLDEAVRFRGRLICKTERGLLVLPGVAKQRPSGRAVRLPLLVVAHDVAVLVGARPHSAREPAPDGKYGKYGAYVGRFRDEEHARLDDAVDRLLRKLEKAGSVVRVMEDYRDRGEAFYVRSPSPGEVFHVAIDGEGRDVVLDQLAATSVCLPAEHKLAVRRRTGSAEALLLFAVPDGSTLVLHQPLAALEHPRRRTRHLFERMRKEVLPLMVQMRTSRSPLPDGTSSPADRLDFVVRMAADDGRFASTQWLAERVFHEKNKSKAVAVAPVVRAWIVLRASMGPATAVTEDARHAAGRLQGDGLAGLDRRLPPEFDPERRTGWEFLALADGRSVEQVKRTLAQRIAEIWSASRR